MVSLDDYERLIAPAREAFAESSAVKALESIADETSCELFLIYFCALGVRMTAPVEDWICRAAWICTNMGLMEVGRALSYHADAEANHHLLMIEDLRLLAAHWNARQASPIHADALLEQAATPRVADYCRLHEYYLASPTPFAQVAIEYEIEQLPSKYGHRATARCVELLGADVLSRLGFLTQHIALDVGHTEFNERMLARLIEGQPSSLPTLVAAGTSALNAYAGFLDDCLQLAGAHARRIGTLRTAPRRALSWALRQPSVSCADEPNRASCTWLESVRSLRGRVFFDNGRRPLFKTSAGGFQDPDPVDPYAFHILAQDGPKLVGCVRLYRLRAGGPPCLTERILGEDRFLGLLKSLGVPRTSIAEIGRWTVDPDYRTRTQDLGLGLRLAAAAAALAQRLRVASGCSDGRIICAVGTADRQDALLERFGLVPAPGIEPIAFADFDDNVRVLYGSQELRLNPHLDSLLDEMVSTLAIHDIFSRESATAFG